MGSKSVAVRVEARKAVVEKRQELLAVMGAELAPGQVLSKEGVMGGGGADYTSGLESVMDSFGVSMEERDFSMARPGDDPHDRPLWVEEPVLCTAATAMRLRLWNVIKVLLDGEVEEDSS